MDTLILAGSVWLAFSAGLLVGVMWAGRPGGTEEP